MPAAALGRTWPCEPTLCSIDVRSTHRRTASDKKFFEQPLDMEVCGCCRHYNMANKDDLLLGSVEVAVGEMQRFKMAGGGAMIEPTSLGIGRDPLGLQEISRASGVHVVMGAAFYVASVHPPELKDWSVAEISKMLVDDIVYGATLETKSPSSGTGTVHTAPNTGVRAGIIGEVGCSWPLHKDEARVLQACAAAQRATGAAISVHPGRDEAAPMEILRVLEAAGADLGRVVMCHVDRTVFEASTLEELVATGCYLEYDLFGMYQSGYYPHNPAVDLLNDAGRVKQIQWLIERGAGHQILVSQDIAGNHRLTKCVGCRLFSPCLGALSNHEAPPCVRWGGHGYHYLLKEIVPMMRARGMAEDEIRALLEGNPQAVLSFKPAALQTPKANLAASTSSAGRPTPRM